MFGLGTLPVSCGADSPEFTELEAIKESLGDAFTKENVSIVGAESAALARRFGAVRHAAQALQWQALPGTATDSLLMWAERLGIPVRPNDKPHEIREQCEAKFKAQSGATIAVINDSLSTLLKRAFIGVRFFYGTTLDNEPSITRWKAGTKGDSEYDLGGLAGDPEVPPHEDGAWYSVRNHLLIEVEQPPELNFDEFLYLVNTKLFDLLDLLMPAHCTFDWALGVYEGFIIGESQLGYHAL